MSAVSPAARRPTLFIYTGWKFPFWFCSLACFGITTFDAPPQAIRKAMRMAVEGGSIVTNDPYFLYKINNLVQKHYAGDPDGLPPNRVVMMIFDSLAGEFRSLKDPRTKIFSLDHIDDLFDDIGQEFTMATDRAYASGRKRRLTAKLDDLRGEWHRAKGGKLPTKSRPVYSIPSRAYAESCVARFVREKCVLVPGGENFGDLYMEYRSWSRARGIYPRSVKSFSKHLQSMLTIEMVKGRQAKNVSGIRLRSSLVKEASRPEVPW